MPVSTAELSWRVLGFVNGLRVLASSSLATLFVSIMPETFGQLDPALFAGAATAYFLYSLISIGSIRRRSPDIVLQTWTGVFADVLVLSLLTYASGGVNGGISALVVLSIGAASFILRRRLAMAIAVAASLAMLVQPVISMLASVDAMSDVTTAAISGALTVIIALGISQLARIMRQNEEVNRQREAANIELTELQRTLSANLREGVLIVDGGDKVSMISDTAATLLQGGSVAEGSMLSDVSSRLANLVDTWRRSFCDESRSTPTMMGFDGERRLQLKFVSLDNSTQGPALIFVEDKSRVAAWMPASMVPATVEVNEVPAPREPVPRPVAPAAVAVRNQSARSEGVRERERAFESPYAAGALREPSYEGGQYAGALSPASALRTSEPRGNPFEEPSYRESQRRQSPQRADSARPEASRGGTDKEEEYRANTLKENIARQNNFRAALQEVSPWENPPKPAAPPPPPARSAPATTAAQPRRQQPPKQPPAPPRPPGSMLTNNDPRLRIIIGNALQFGKRESLRLQRVDLASWSKEFLSEFWLAEEIDSETLRLSAPRESVPVRADPAHLHKLLWMLCTDLLKYGRATNAYDPIEIRVGRSATTQRRYLDVIDRGSAVGPVDSKRVFEPFLAAGKAGTGISMFVSRELSPGVRSGANNDPRPGGGVVFRLVFADAPAPKPVESAD
ncbi:MAG TPA: ATP-binding protein [Steroidobacter sp.]